MAQRGLGQVTEVTSSSFEYESELFIIIARLHVRDYRLFFPALNDEIGKAGGSRTESHRTSHLSGRENESDRVSSRQSTL